MRRVDLPIALAAAVAACAACQRWPPSGEPPTTIGPDPASPQASSARTAAGQASAYRDGVGVPRDEGRALSLFREACDGNVARACGDLAAMYADGIGVP